MSLRIGILAKEPTMPKPILPKQICKKLFFKIHFRYIKKKTCSEFGVFMTIDEFMILNGFSSETGYITKCQKNQFQKRLSQISGIRWILEIGFNAGHSAECFFENCKDLEQFVAFDVNFFPYTKPAANHLQNLHPNRFSFIQGNSLVTIPSFAKNFPKVKFDLIYIDGSHHFEDVIKDIKNTKLLAHEKTILWMDDFHYRSVYWAFQYCQMEGIVQKKRVFSSSNPERKWIEASYTGST